MDNDLFIIHANEDKDIFVRQLAEAIQTEGLSVQFEDYAMKTGDSLQERIDAGLTKSRYGAIVLSNNFFAIPWTKQEITGTFQQVEECGKIMIPLWHGVSRRDVAFFSPILASKTGINTEEDVDSVALRLLDAIISAASVITKIKQDIGVSIEGTLPQVELSCRDILSMYKVCVEQSGIQLVENELSKKYSKSHPIVLQILYAVVADNSGIEQVELCPSAMGCDQIFQNEEKLYVPIAHLHPDSRAYARILDESGLPSLRHIVFQNNFPVPKLSGLDLVNQPTKARTPQVYQKRNLYVWTGMNGVSPASPVLRKMDLTEPLTYLDHVYIGGGTGWSDNGDSDICVILTSTPRREQPELKYNMFYALYDESLFPDGCQIESLSGGSRAEWLIQFKASEPAEEERIINTILRIHTQQIKNISSKRIS